MNSPADHIGKPARGAGAGWISLAAALLIGLASACGLIKPVAVVPAAGPEFPMVQAGALSYEGRLVPPAVRREGKVVFATDVGLVYALDAGRPAMDWVFRISHSVSRPANLGRERVYVLDDRNTLICLDLAGRLLWARSLDENPAGPVNEAGSLVFVGTEPGSLIALRQEDGSEAWRFRAKAALRTGAVSWTDAQGRSTILCGGDEGLLFVLSSDGRSRGRLDCGGKIILPPLLDGDRLYIGTEDQRVLCIDLGALRKRWQVRLTGRAATVPLADDRRLFFLTAQGVLMCLDKRRGSVLWWKTISSRAGFAPALAGDRILVTSLSERLVGFSVRDGEETQGYLSDREVRSNPIWVAPVLLVHVDDKTSGGGILLFLRKEKTDGSR